MTCSAARFTPKCARHCTRPLGRSLFSPAFPRFGISRGFLSRGSRALRQTQFHSGAPGFRQTNGYSLLGGTCAVFSLANVMYLFPDKFSSLR
jgi:hypothetical protein